MGLVQFAAAFLAAATAASGLLAVIPEGPALADQVESTRQQVAVAEAQAVAGARRVHALTAEYAQANLEASSLSALVATGQAQVARLEADTAQASARLRQEALASYTGAYTGVPSFPSGSDASAIDPSVRAGYVSVASGDLTDSLDSYRASQRELAQAQSSLAARQKESVTAATALQRARDAAISEATADQARLDALQSQLTSLEAAQAAQAAAAAAAAKAAAAKASPPTAPASQGPPVNGGLVAVVRAAVTPTPAPAPVVTAPPVTVAPAPPTTAPAPTYTTSGDGGAGGVWLQLRQCESGDDYQANTGNGYFGAYQFSQQTWSNLGFPGRPDLEPPSMQDQAAMQLQAQSGWGQWPACSAALGLT